MDTSKIFGSIKMIWKIAKSKHGAIWVITGLSVAQSILQVTMALLTRNVIDAALGNREHLLLYAVLLLCNVLTLIFGEAAHAWLVGSTGDKLSAGMRKRILCTTLFSRDEYLLDHHSGELLSRGIEDVYTVASGAATVLPTLIGQTARLVATTVAIFLIQPAVAGVLLIGALILGTVVACLRPIIKKRQRMVRQTDDQVMAAMQEDMQQLELIQSLDVQEQVLHRFQRYINQNLSARRRRRKWAVLSSSIVNSAAQVATAGLLLWGAVSIANNILSYGALTALLQLLALFRGPVLGLSNLWSRLANVEIAADRLEKMLAEQTVYETEQTQAKLQQIVFENVSFAYPGEETLVLENVSFRFSMDQWVCLTGVSGKGKTTMFKLILGLYKPKSGRVYLVTDQGEIDCSESTRHFFAYVPQDFALLSGSILDNLRLVAPDVDDEQLRQALSIAQADFVWDLAGLEMTQVRENNTGLSKGQLQRLAIARAVLMQRQVYLLDECTSALDAQTEDGVLRALKAQGKQAVLVTHRPEALDVLDNIHRVSLES